MKLSRPLTQENFVVITKPARRLLDIEEGDIIEVEISHRGTTIHEIKKMSSNGRIYISQKLRDALDVKEGDIITLDIKNVVKRERR